MTKKRRTDIELREYKITREKNKQLRKYAPNPFASLNEHGIVGKATNKVANHIAEKPIRNIAYRMTSRKYKKGFEIYCRFPCCFNNWRKSYRIFYGRCFRED